MGLFTRRASVRSLQRVAIPENELRIALVSDAIFGRNGVGTYYKDLTDHLDGRIGRVSLICPGVPGTRYHSFSLPMPGDKTQKLYVPNMRRIRAEFQAVDPHGVVVATPGPYGFYALRLARLTGIPACTGFHTDFESLADIYYKGIRGPITMKSMEWLHKIFFAKGALTATTSENMMEFVSKVGAKDVRLVGTPIARTFIDTPIKPLGGKLERVLFAGRLAPEKNVEAVLAAAKARPEIRFIIAGDGPLRPKVERAAAELKNIDFLGWVSTGKVVGLMDRADMLLLPSFVESFGTVALEAMARERLVLLSAHCGISEWGDFSQHLYVIGKDESVGDAVKRVADLPSGERLETARAGRRLVRDFIEESVQQWLDILPVTVKKAESGPKAEEIASA